MKNFTKTSFLLILMLSVTGILATAQTLPRLDNTFGTGGVIRPSFGGDSASFKHIVLLPDGKYLATGSIEAIRNFAAKTDALVTRLMPDGKMDTTFRGTHTGYDITELYGSYDYGRLSLVQPDGKYICMGMSSTRYDDACTAFIFRLNSNGQPDLTWGNNASFLISNTSAFHNPIAANLFSDGKLLVAYGSPEESDVFNRAAVNISFLKLTSNGQRDITFASNGSVALMVPGSSTTWDKHYLTDMKVQADGKIVFCGYVRRGFNATYTYFLGRLTEFGTLDASFGTNGLSLNQFSINQYPKIDTLRPKGLFIQPDGKILMYSRLGTLDLHVARFNANGTLDNAYGINGSMSYSIPNKGFIVGSAALQPDGKLLVGGSSPSLSYQTFIPRRYGFGVHLRRFLSDGQLDLSFGNNGIWSTMPSDTTLVSSLVIQPDGKLVVAGGLASINWPTGGSGTRYGRAFMLRLLTDINLGLVNLDKEQEEILIYPNPIAETAQFKYQLETETEVSIELVDVNGAVLHRFAEFEQQKAGQHLLNLHFPSAIASGNYYIVLKSKNQRFSVAITKQ